MQMDRLLRPQAIKVLGKVSSKKKLFQTLSEIAAEVYGVNAPSALKALQEREALGPTGVGNGVALPHARLPDVEHVVGVFLRAETPLDYDSVDRKPVDLVFALFAPEMSGVDHLKALALVSRSLRDTGLCAKLRANTDPSVIYTILADNKSSKAA
jgi:PTS system nitrogen regulatory IIA component